MSRTTVKTRTVETKPVLSYRVQQRFWLDIARPAEDKLNREIEKMKKNRTFASTMRDSLRLIVDLREGKLDVLCELFPWVAEQLQKPAVQVVQPTPSDQFNDILKELNRLRTVVEQRGQVMPALPSLPFSLVVEVDPNADTRPMQPVAAVANMSRQNFAASIGDMFAD